MGNTPHFGMIAGF
ncbi:hypothetical protein HU200_032047 [Digitaria exilis]|uniref:Uncharacterized protein n=1 Tax=Digitaria exilis TaxID=1010633 RepID=A0A835BN96_9POAL|nr:hypothetical protein HU200_032047 [Digitaria exilis]